MDPTDSARALLSSIPMFASRDWGSPEKNQVAMELARSIQTAVHRKDDALMKKLVLDVQYFMSPTFLVFKRMEILVKRDKAWRTSQDNVAWSGMIARARTIIERKDSKEIVEIATRFVTFLRARNEHILAKSIEEALNVGKSRK